MTPGGTSGRGAKATATASERRGARDPAAAPARDRVAPTGGAADYGRLDPPQVLAALDAVGLRGDGRVLQLNSYENRVCQVFVEDGRVVVAKFYRPGRWSDAQILEEHAFALELATAEVPVVPPLILAAAGADGGLALVGDPPTLAHAQTDGATCRFAVADRCAGREPELADARTLARIGGFIGRLHAVGRRRPFVHRHRLDAARDGADALATVRASGRLSAAEAGAWLDAAARAVDAAAERFAGIGDVATLRLHGDCHIGNVLWRQDGEHGRPHVVDLDDAMQGPAVQDLWMLVSGDATSMAAQLDTLLDGYRRFADFDDRERSLIEPLRTLRMVRHSAWLAARWDDPTFPLNFPFFGSAAYWSQQTAQLREQLAAIADG